jgi:hypothetical protein
MNVYFHQTDGFKARCNHHAAGQGDVRAMGGSLRGGQLRCHPARALLCWPHTHQPLRLYKMQLGCSAIQERASCKRPALQPVPKLAEAAGQNRAESHHGPADIID